MNEDDVTWIFSRLGVRVDFSYGKRSYFLKTINIVQGYILVYCSCLQMNNKNENGTLEVTTADRSEDYWKKLVVNSKQYINTDTTMIQLDTLWSFNSLRTGKWPIEIGYLLIKDCDFPQLFANVYQRLGGWKNSVNFSSTFRC